jgi:hypothetical protein
MLLDLPDIRLCSCRTLGSTLSRAQERECNSDHRRDQDSDRQGESHHILWLGCDVILALLGNA